MWKKTGELETNEVDIKMEPTVTKKTARGVSTIGSQAVITGEIRGNEDLLIMGSFDGNILLDKSMVTIGKSGNVKGKIHAKVISVEGTMDGDLKAKNKITLKDSSKVKANLVTARLVIDDGCHFHGSIDMGSIAGKEISSEAIRQKKPIVPPVDTLAKNK